MLLGNQSYKEIKTEKQNRRQSPDRKACAGAIPTTFLNKSPLLSGLQFPQARRAFLTLPLCPLEGAGCRLGENLPSLMPLSPPLFPPSPTQAWPLCATPSEQIHADTCPPHRSPALPGVAVGGEALPGLHAAAGHGEGAPAAAIQLHEQGLGCVLGRLPAVVGSLQHLSDVLIPRLVS